MNTLEEISKIVVIDDDHEVRVVIKNILNLEYSYKVFTSSNGLEGTGYAIISQPRMVILDSTLPKYSGKELVEYLTNNKFFNDTEIPVLLIKENNKLPKIPPHYFSVHKDDPKFLEKIITFTNYSVSGRVVIDRREKKYLLRMFLGKKVILWSHTCKKLSLLMNRKNRWISWIYYLGWCVSKIFTNTYMSLFFVVTGKIRDENFDQNIIDETEVKLKVYPTILTAFSTVIVLITQFTLILFGEITVMDYKAKSIFTKSNNTANTEIYKK